MLVSPHTVKLSGDYPRNGMAGQEMPRAKPWIVRKVLQSDNSVFRMISTSNENGNVNVVF